MMATPHLGFIVAAYALATLTTLAMIAAILLDYRTLVTKLRALEGARADVVERMET
jgi:heme exporter protein CcmD